MGVTAIECEQRWTVLRNKYNTLKRVLRNRPSGSASYTITWPYYELMKFLDPFIQQRRTTTNLSYSQSIPESICTYSGVHNTINSSDSGEELSDVFDVHNHSTDEQKETDDTQALYENFIENRKLSPAKRMKTVPKSTATVAEKSNNPTQLQESQILNINENLAEIKRLRNIKKSKDDKSEKDGIVNKLGGCVSTFEKFIEHKQSSEKEDEDFVKSLSKDLSVFTPAEKISQKRERKGKKILRVYG